MGEVMNSAPLAIKRAVSIKLFAYERFDVH